MAQQDGLSLVQSLLSKKAGSANFETLLDKLWQKFGEADGIADAAKEQYDAGKDGSSAKLNMLTNLITQIGVLSAKVAKTQSALPEVENLAELAAVVNHAMKMQNEQNTVEATVRAPSDARGIERLPSPLGTGDNSKADEGDELAS